MKLQYDKEKLNTFCRENEIRYLGLFGSFSRGDADQNSDVDLLVDFINTPSLLRHISLEFELSEDIFNNRKVDLITKRALNREISKHIEKDLQTIYETR